MPSRTPKTSAKNGELIAFDSGGLSADCDTSQHNLTLPLQQAQAVVGLLGGLSVTDAAKAAGVSRATVHRWLKDDFTFQAAVNQGQRELQEALQCRLLNLAEDAVSCVEKVLQAGDGKAALALLKGLGFLKCRSLPIGSSDPKELEARHKEEIARNRFRSFQ